MLVMAAPQGVWHDRTDARPCLHVNSRSHIDVMWLQVGGASRFTWKV